MASLFALPYSVPDGQVLRTPHLIGSNIGPARVIGSGAIRSENYVAGSAGWSIDGDGNVEFASGTFRGDITGATGTFSGTVSGGQIDIGGSDTSSFHVDADGNLWLGAATYLAPAPFRVSNSGQIDIGGDDATSWHVDNTGFMWSGATTANKATAPFRVDTAGVVYCTDIRISGGTIGGTNINGNVTLSTSGVFRTASSGKRIEMTQAAGDTITFYTGNVNEFIPGQLLVTSGYVELRGPYLTTGPSTSAKLTLQNDAATISDQLTVIAGSTDVPRRLTLSSLYPNAVGDSWGSAVIFDSEWVTGGGSKQWAIVGGHKGGFTAAEESFMILENPNLSATDISTSATIWMKMGNGQMGIYGRSPSSTFNFDVGLNKMRLASGTSGYAYLQFGNSGTAGQNTHIVNTGSGAVQFYSGNPGSGSLRFAIGMTLPYAIEIEEWSGGSAYTAITTSSASTNGYMVLTDNTSTFFSTPGITGNAYIRPAANNMTYQIVVTTSGIAATLYPTASANTVRDAGFSTLGYFSSRAETKKNVRTVKGDDALDRIMQLRPIEFTFKKEYIGDGSNDMVEFDRKRGFIAEEVEAVDRLAAIYGWLEPGERRRLAKPRETPLPLKDAIPIQWSPEAMVADLVAAVQNLHERIITLEEV